MARAAAYGNIQPSEFLDMDIDDASELSRRVTLMRQQEWQNDMELRTEIAKAIIKSNQTRIG